MLTPMQQQMSQLGASTRPDEDPGTVPTMSSQAIQTFEKVTGEPAPAPEPEYSMLGKKVFEQSDINPPDLSAIETGAEFKEFAPVYLPFTSLKIPGAATVSEYTPKINWKKTQPDISLTEILPLDDDDYRENRFMTFDAVENAGGQRYLIKDLPYDKRLDIADRFGAVKFVRYDDSAPNGERVVDIPWEEKIIEKVDFPEGFEAPIDGRMLRASQMTYDQYKRMMMANRITSTALNPDPEVGIAMQGQYLNNILAEAGMDARSRYFILNENLKTMGQDDVIRMVEGAGEVLIKGTLDTVLFGVGETAGLIAKLPFFDANMSDTVADYHTREAASENYWRPLAYDVVEHFAQQNVVVPLSVARDLASVQTGLIPTTGQLAIEIIAPSKIALAKMGMSGKAELERFEAFAESKLRTNKDLTQDELITQFLEKRSEDPMFAFETPSGVAFTVGVPGKLAKRSKKNAVEERLVRGFQIQDTMLDVSQRAEVVTQTKYIAGLELRKDNLQKRFDTEPTDEIAQELSVVNQQLSDGYVDMANIRDASSTPKFMRDIKVQDRYILFGAAGTGFVFGDILDKDSELGQLIGIGVGFAFSAARAQGKPALRAIRARLPKRSDRQNIEWFVSKLQQLNPAMKLEIQAHGEKLLGYQDELIAAGVRPDSLKLALPVVTDIATLRLFDRQTTATMSMKDTMSPAGMEQLQESLSLNNRLNTELETILADMRVSTDADQQFYNFIDAVVKQNKEHMDSLRTRIETMETGAVGYYLNSVNGNTQALNPGSPLNAESASEVPTFSEALDSLRADQLINTAALPGAALKKEMKRTSTAVNNAIILKSNELLFDIGSDNQARKDFRKQNSKNVYANTTPSGLFMMHVEDQYSAAKTIAQKPYAHMESGDVQFYVGQNPVSGKDLTVDASDVLGSFFAMPVSGPSGMTTIRTRLSENLSAAERKAVDDLMVELSEPFFMEQAASEGISYTKWLAKQKSRYTSLGKSYQGRNPVARTAELIMEEIAEQTDGQATMPFFEMSPLALRKVGQYVTNLKYKNRENGAVFNSLSEIENLIDSKFNEFSLDGQSAETLGILNPDTGKVEALTEYIDKANTGYSQFKKTWHDTDVDNSFIAVRMAHGNQKSKLLSGDNPTGKSYGDRPINEMLTIADLENPERANRFMLSLSQAMGSPVGKKGFRLVEGEDNTVVAQSYIRAIVGEHFANASRTGSMTAKEMGDMARRIEENITMVSSTGREKPLISFASIIDNTVGDLEISIPRQILDEANATVANKIDKAVAAAVKPAKERMQLHEDAVTILRKATSLELDMDNIASWVVGGGRNRYNKIMGALTSAGKTVEEARAVLRDSYILQMEKDLFFETGRELVHPGSTGKEARRTMEKAVNPAALNIRLGATDADKQLIQEILGEETYKVWRATASFLAEVNNNPLANSSVIMKGAPRSLSVESYISRFYAINRGVVRPQYVGTEAALQQIRAKNFDFLQAVIRDPKLGQMFLETVRTGKPLDPARQVEFSNLLIQGYAQNLDTHRQETRKVVDAAGRTFTLNATVEDKVRMGYSRDFQQEYQRKEGQPFMGPVYAPSLDAPIY